MDNKHSETPKPVYPVTSYFNRFFDRAMNSSFSPVVAENPGISLWKLRIFVALNLTVLISGFFALIPSIIFSFQMDKPEVAVLDIVIYTGILFNYIKKGIPYEFRVKVVLLLFYLLGTLLLLMIGPKGAGLIYLFSFSVLTGILLGMRATIMSLIITVITIIVIGAGISMSLPGFGLVEEFTTGGWVILSINFIVLDTIVAVPLAFMIQGLETNLQTEKLARIKLKEGQEKLILAKEKAEEADRLKSAFLSNMSHEIRTPMNAILGFSNLLKDREVDESERNEYLKYISNSGDQLLHLIDDIIDISKIEAGELSLHYDACQVNDLLREIHLAFYHSPRRSPGVDIILQPAIRENSFTVRTDPYRLQQILTNLVGNALKFTERGNITIGYFFRDFKTLEFFVKDTGVGIPEAQLGNVFKRFSKVESNQTRIHEGTGLGLAICKNLVEMMGGTIEVNSTPGVATTFSFTLPITVIDEEDDLIEEKLRIDKTTNWEDKTILIAEDDEQSYNLLSKILEPTRAKIIHCTSGQEAVDICEFFEPIDLILMDIQMPDKDGFSALREIKTRNNNLPVVAQTAFAMAGEKAKGLEAGFDAFLTKPIRDTKLLNTLRPFLNPA